MSEKETVVVPEKVNKKKKLLLGLIIGGVALLAVGLTLWLVLGSSCGGRRDVKREMESLESTVPEHDYSAPLGTRLNTISNQNGTMALTEAEATAAFARRGFKDFPVYYCYDMNGDYTGDLQASATSTVRHPYYFCAYWTGSGAVWQVEAFGSTFFAEPLSYMERAGWKNPHLVTETDTILFYDSAANAYNEIRPDTNGLFIKKIGQIDAESLAALTMEEVDKP